MTELQPIIRIVLRYAIGALIVNGSIGTEGGAVLLDPVNLEVIAGVVMMLATEGWYWFAKRRGGAV